MNTMKQLTKLYQACFPDKNAVEELSALGKNFKFDIFENKAFIIYNVVSEDEAEIIDIGTAPEFRNKGLAQNLLEKTLLKLKAQNIKTIFLEVAENNVSALKLYEICGFEKYNLRKNYYKSQSGRINALLLKKSI
jgi:[ribosomal protein S18]-alanine N-acetyltransferase